MSDADRQRLGRAVRSVGLYVGIASAVVLVVGVGGLLTLVLTQARHESGEHDNGTGAPPSSEPAPRVVDLDLTLVGIIAFAIVAVILLAVVAWLAARRAVSPLAEALRLQRNFVADASHELRTPLAVMDGRVQIIERRLKSGEPVDDMVERLRADTASMRDVLDDLLLAAEQAETSPGEATSALAAARQAAETLEVLADEAGLSIEVSGDEQARVTVPAVPLVRCVVALADNALRHSPSGSVLRLEAAVDGREVVIRVIDAGPGIDPADQHRIFERFARDRESGTHRGFGLGLALVRDVVRRYRGDVSIESSGPTGTTMAIRLPAVQ